MNKIEAIEFKSEYAREKHLVVAIDNEPLDLILDRLFPENNYKGLVSTFLDWFTNLNERRVVWERVLPDLNKTTVCPILMCSDDLDFYCTIIVAEIERLETVVNWKRIGLDNGSTDGLPDSIGSTVKWFKQLSYQFEINEYKKCLDRFEEEMKNALHNTKPSINPAAQAQGCTKKQGYVWVLETSLPITMENKRFSLISCESIVLFCILIAYALGADKKQIFDYRQEPKFNREERADKWKVYNDLYTISENYAVNLPLALSYNTGTTVPSVRTAKMSNNPPNVKIIAPENNSFFDWNSSVSYIIQVSDAEDGESDNLEIASNEVLLEVVYLPDASMSIDYVSKKTNHFDSPGISLLKTADCFNCHAVKTRLQGPSFLEIARRYPHNPTTVKMLAERVIQGSSGIWGIPAMSSHPDLTKEQAGEIIRWIFENAEDLNRSYYSGTKGTFQTKARSKSNENGMYVLSASYTDHGLKGMRHLSKSGLHTVVLHSK